MWRGGVAARQLRRDLAGRRGSGNPLALHAVHGVNVMAVPYTAGMRTRVGFQQCGLLLIHMLHPLFPHQADRTLMDQLKHGNPRMHEAILADDVAALQAELARTHRCVL